MLNGKLNDFALFNIMLVMVYMLAKINGRLVPTNIHAVQERILDRK